MITCVAINATLIDLLEAQLFAIYVSLADFFSGWVLSLTAAVEFNYVSIRIFHTQISEFSHSLV